MSTLPLTASNPDLRFICLDGPKGTGKTTVLEAATHALRALGHKVVRLSEKNCDPQRGPTMALVNQLARHPDPALELEVCRRLADSRAWISRQVLPRQPSGCIVLMDRWYPSDAAFRRLLPFEQVLQLNLEQRVRVPDLHMGITTAPEISWARAAARARGLGSTVLQHVEEHAACTHAFEQAAQRHGWALCRNEGSVEAAVEEVVARVRQVL